MGNADNEERPAGQNGVSISADTVSPTKEATPIADNIHVGRDASAARPLSNGKSENAPKTAMVDSVREKASKTVQGAVTPQYTTLSDKAQRLCRIADQILGYMAEVEDSMEQFQRYIQTQKEANQPLYKWTKYTGYRQISRAITDLDEVVSRFEAVILPPQYVNMYLSRATQLSLSVSKIAVFAMGVMNEKSTSCIDEIEESALSAEDKANAQTLITSELKKLLKHCARATNRVYVSLDLLRNALIIDRTHRAPVSSPAEDVVAYEKVRSGHTSASRLRSIAGLVFGAATSAAIGLAAAHFYGTSSLNPALRETGGGCTSQILDLVQRTQAITNLTGEVYSIKLQDLDERYNELKDFTESHGLRIDNLVEALGAPNEQGTYYTSASSPKQAEQVPVDVRSYIQKVASDANLEVARLHNELEQMRKNINRMDIRLMKRLNKLDR